MNCLVTKVRFALLGLPLLLAASCATLERSGLVKYPQVSIEKVALASLGKQHVEVDVGLLISNQNPLGSSFTGFDYRLEVNGQTLVEGVFDEPFEVKARGESRLVLPVRFGFADLQQIMADLKDEDEFDYNLQTTAHLDVAGLGSVPLSSTEQGRLPNVRLPEIRLVGFSVASVGLTSANLLVTVEVDNPNSFTVTPNSLDYSLDVNGSRWAVGELRNLTPVSGRGATSVALPVRLSMAEAGNSLFSIISGGGNNLRYEFNGNLGFDTDLPGIQGLEIPLYLTGDLKLN